MFSSCNSCYAPVNTCIFTCVTSGRIKAIQLEYSEARRTLTNALRKAPQHTAVGFKQTVCRHWGGWFNISLVVVQMLTVAETLNVSVFRSISC